MTAEKPPPPPNVSFLFSKSAVVMEEVSSKPSGYAATRIIENLVEEKKTHLNFHVT